MVDRGAGGMFVLGQGQRRLPKAPRDREEDLHAAIYRDDRSVDRLVLSLGWGSTTANLT